MSTAVIARPAPRRRRRTFAFQHVATVWPMLPANVLEHVAAADPKPIGLRSFDYGVATSERLGEAITRSLPRLAGIHRAFTADLDSAPLLNPAAGPTYRQRGRLPFQELGNGSLTATPAACTLDDGSGFPGQLFPISHQWNPVPIHPVGVYVPPDRSTAGVTGALVADERSTFGLSADKERTTYGPHYAPDPLVPACLDTTLQPVVAERLNGTMCAGPPRSPLPLIEATVVDNLDHRFSTYKEASAHTAVR